MAPDPERAFVSFLRARFAGWTVDTKLPSARPAVVVNLLPGGSIDLRQHIDRDRVDLVCYGDDPRAMAAQVRETIFGGFTAAGQRVFGVVPSPPFPLADALTNEARWYVPITCLITPS